MKRSFSFICLIVLLAFAGCGKKQVQEPIEITLMHGWGGDLKTHRLMQEIYAEFDRQNPDVVLTAIPYADSRIVVEKANDMLAVGKMPDIVSTNGYGYYVMNAAKRGMALDLMPFLEEDETLRELIHPAVLDVWKTGTNRLYTVPDALEMAGYWYNASYFEEAGIAMPPSTWKEFFDKMETFQIFLDEKKPEVAVCNLEENQLEEFLFLARLAGEGEAGRKLAGNSYASFDESTIFPVIRDMERLLVHSKQVDNLETARQNFWSGKNVLYFNGVWESNDLMESPFVADFAYAAYPTNEGETLAYTSPSSGYVLAVQEDKRKEEAALRFLKYILSDEVQKKIAMETGQAPSNPNISLEEIEKKKPLLAEAVRTVREADIQINTIRSVWPEEKFILISDMLKKRKFSEEDVRELVKRWKKK